MFRVLLFFLCVSVFFGPAFARGESDTVGSRDSTPAIARFDSLGRNSDLSRSARKIFSKISDIASKNRQNGIYTVSLDILLDIGFQRSEKDLNDSINASGGAIILFAASKDARKVELAPLGRDGAAFRIIDGDTILMSLTPLSSLEDVTALREKLSAFFKELLDLHRLYRKVKSPAPAPEIRDPAG
jgi:hypothetical protein